MTGALPLGRAWQETRRQPATPEVLKFEGSTTVTDRSTGGIRKRGETFPVEQPDTAVTNLDKLFRCQLAHGAL